MEKKSLQKYDNLNPVVLNFLLNSGIEQPSILDVGCWMGTLGRMLIDKHFSCVIDGIDVDINALNIAKGECGYENVYHKDLNHLQGADIRRTEYDLIVFGDVLEHIIDPNKLISVLLPKLSHNGYLIISLPNIAFLKYRLLHLFGNWDYTETGVMDKTHLRFFTLFSMKELFCTNRLEIVEQKELVAVSNIYWPIKILAKIWPNMFALQMVFKLKPKK